MVVHLLSACFCLGSSAMFHTFMIHSKTANTLLSRLDYGGISILIMGSSYPGIFYGFACHQVYTTRNWFLALITTTSTCCFLSTMHPAMNTGPLRSVRGFMFIILGLSAGIPLFYMSKADKRYISFEGASQWELGGAIYIIGALIYVFRIPERWQPKKFDLAFSSHNIFHLFVVSACIIHVNEALNMYHDRREKICPIDLPV
uniref:Uncharacterized protein n=1 Tax=Strombidium inclinatum TaxID=197538 RepID=A0A7S3MY52_9SPIT|mmetsp:Transcript_2050/g.3071  ORF Transcript_2050/g.3071 Transcript_2050/m.3071 type:complete len:202 (+) Transcript_2050:1229-1834(+)